jgi:hypothetical protein
MFGPFTDIRAGVEIGSIFGRAGERIREKRERSSERESLGNRARAEPSDTDELINDFETAIRHEVGEVGRESVTEQTEYDIEFYPTNLQVGEENSYGADIGVRLHMEANGFNITKGILFQCKRMYGNEQKASYDALRGDGEAQAEKMLKITPASFLMLFNGVRAEILADWIKPPACIYPIARRFGPWPFGWREFWRFANLMDPPYSLWNTGITVLPASRVYAESRVSRRESKALVIDAKHWVQASVPLGVFMADLFGSCFVGDVRSSVLRLVTPPKLRDLNTSGIDDSDGSFSSVRRMMNVRVTQRQG